jgi:hypothetical protein
VKTRGGGVVGPTLFEIRKTSSTTFPFKKANKRAEEETITSAATDQHRYVVKLDIEQDSRPAIKIVLRGI